jgi:serine/threonine protein kinase
MSAEQTPTQGEDQRQVTEDLSRAPTRPLGEVPGYEPQKFLGRGGFGEVWVAVQRNTGVRTAIKFFTHRGGLDWSLLTREVEKLRFLSNDRYVVQLLEVGWEADPPYYVMEYVEGGSLDDLLQAGPLPAYEAVELFREAAIGLSHAHHKGILHCDLKPANILLDQDRRPRLADFGQARLTEEVSAALGSWFYMAPEQADFNAVPDVRWDVYALGAIFYCMLTGQPPHRTEQISRQLKEPPRLEDRLRRYRKLVTEAPPPALHRERPGVDSALAEIVDRCLVVSPHKRFPNVQAVLDALDERALRRTRRPVLLIGLLGPALAMLAICALCWFPLRNTIASAAEEIRENHLREQRAAAQSNARSVADQIEKRFQVLEREAAVPAFRRLLAEADAEADSNAPKRRELERYLTDMHVRNANDFKALFWFIDDARGTELAITPLEKGQDTIGKNYRWRDYFHGRGQDYSPDDPRVTTLAPLRGPHRSALFQSTSTGAGQPYTVAFSVPVWPADGPVGAGSPIGILATSAEVGDFSQLSLSKHEAVVLVDLRTPVDDRRGIILQHPELEALQRANTPRSQMVYCLSPDEVQRIDDIRRSRQFPVHGAGPDESVILDYHDPLAARAPDKYGGTFLAAVEPVFVRIGAEQRDAGWVVIVEGRGEEELGWISDVIARLTRGLVWRSLLGVACVLVVVTALSGYVVRSLDRTSRARRGSSGDAGLASTNSLSARLTSSEADGNPRTPS